MMPWSSSTTDDGQPVLVDRWHPGGPALNEQGVKSRLIKELNVNAERVTVHVDLETPNKVWRLNVDVESITSSESEHLRAFLTYVLPGAWEWSVNSPEVKTEVSAELLSHLRDRLLWRPKS